ncbi:MAG: DUF4124 domain-containing protein [Dokdonella sp.]|uniref:DUF4124 domain-containing protein n=1 Tax=Dokdonella sp. TaxID=2291710 RepID=UPI003F808C06
MIRAIALLALLPLTAAATEVYRCAGVEGVSFQDKPCADATEQSVLHLADPRPPPTAETPAPVAVEVAAPAVEAPAPPPPAVAPPTLYLCTATDGSRYVSEDGVGRRSWVPYAMVAGSGKSLAQTYGPGGAGVSAPELQHPPSTPARADPLDAGYVWVVDECHHADRVEACAYLRNELDKVTGQLRRAFSDTEAQLEQEQAQLRERLRGC